MQKKTIILTIGVALAILGCSQNNDRVQDEKKSIIEGSASPEATDQSNSSRKSQNGFISSSAAVETGSDSMHQFIRTADLKFKVKNVILSTYDIEDITRQYKGFVTYTNLTSHVNRQTVHAVTADSSIETTFYTVINEMTLRVPNTKLDSTLKAIARNIDYLDYRVIKADNVALDLLANELTQKRTAKNEARLAKSFGQQGSKPNEVVDAAELLSRKDEEADNATIATLSLNDQIAYSTIKLSIYQREEVKFERIENYENVDEYHPGFGSDFIDSLTLGWWILKQLILFITKLWVFILVGIVVIYLYKRNKSKLAK